MKYKVLGERLRWVTALGWGSRRPLRGITKKKAFFFFKVEGKNINSKINK